MPQLTEIELGIGTSAWGNSWFWGFGKTHRLNDLKETYAQILNRTNIVIDTAEIYGLGKSETFIGQFATNTNYPLIATKFFPFPWRLTKSSLLTALRSSLRRLQLNQVDLYQIHWGFPPVSINTWMEALAQAIEEGLTKMVGVSNYSPKQTQTAYNRLNQLGTQLASNQVHYSLLNREIEHNGLLALCKQLGVRVIAYSPLEQGLLTGKYSPENPPPGMRGIRYRSYLAAIQPLINTMREIGKAYAVDGIVRTPAQIALNWCICKGTLPIPGAKNARQAEINLRALGWRLSSEEIAILDSLSNRVIANL